MATARSRVKASRKPSFRLYIADDFRREADGKVSGIGLYTDLVVVANLLPGAAPPTLEAPLVLHGLAALVTIAGLGGNHSLAVEFKDSLPARPPEIQGDKKVDFKEGQTANLILRFQPFVTGGPGLKTIVVKIDDEPHELNFEVRLGKQRRPRK
ncbi:hypothetical protein [Variovorax sp. PBL-H6]|uniref:hypothetical protein n=1 Tax=Variovorax sp. PBL-H6 TaxID=434009 RepID=UPI0013A559F7|nr:hypothetical protein [Variovorax sp. PBL-H6]